MGRGAQTVGDRWLATGGGPEGPGGRFLRDKQSGRWSPSLYARSLSDRRPQPEFSQARAQRLKRFHRVPPHLKDQPSARRQKRLRQGHRARHPANRARKGDMVPTSMLGVGVELLGPGVNTVDPGEPKPPNQVAQERGPPARGLDQQHVDLRVADFQHQTGKAGARPDIHGSYPRLGLERRPVAQRAQKPLPDDRLLGFEAGQVDPWDPTQ